MRLEQLLLENFRNFYGSQCIEFAGQGQDRNVTLIHGYNGAGKTALLNAFVWCLYGETTPDFEAKERLTNERAIAEAEPGTQIPLSVRLHFAVEGTRYVALRKALTTKDRDGKVHESKPELTLYRTDERGEHLKETGPDSKIQHILPQSMHKFFFFNGERVERLAAVDAYRDVEEGIKTLLDVEIFERSMRHLQKDVSDQLSQELKKYATEEMQVAIDKVQAFDSQITVVESELAQCDRNVKDLEVEIERIESQQLANQATSELQRERQQLQDDLSKDLDHLGEVRTDMARSLSSDGYLALCEMALDRSESAIAAARHRGELPAKIKPTFVDDLLERGDCICGRPLGDSERSLLGKWKESTGLASVEERVGALHAGLVAFDRRRRGFFVEIARLHDRRSHLETQRRALDDRLSDLDRQLSDKSIVEDAFALEQKRKSLVRKKEDERLLRREASEKLGELQTELQDAKRAEERVRGQDSKAELIRRQRQAVERVADVLGKLYQLQKQEVREDLAGKIAEIWNDAAVKDYHASVSDDFRLVLTRRFNGVEDEVHGASTGEKQVLALAFVGSLVRKALEMRERSAARQQAGDDPLTRGGQYPLVIDSPFGQLGEQYGRKVAEWIPKLAGQVVLLVSDSQWRSEVESGVQNRVGREYILELHSPKKSAANVGLRGRSYSYVVSANVSEEMTRIREVE